MGCWGVMLQPVKRNHIRSHNLIEHVDWGLSTVPAAVMSGCIPVQTKNSMATDEMLLTTMSVDGMYMYIINTIYAYLK